MIRNDITKVTCDAIVNAANSSLLGGGGVDGAIHRAAGKELLMECKKLNGCEVGQAKITGGYRLPCKYVIHTVGPIWKDGRHNEQELLSSCYRNALHIALDYHCQSVAFPLISSGAYGYPKDQALHVAVDTITKFLLNHEMMVYIVVYDQASFQISEALYQNITTYIQDTYVDENFDIYSTWHNASDESTVLCDTNIFPKRQAKNVRSISATRYLEDAFHHLDESFTEMLLRKIDERNMLDVQCYKKANIDRKLFSKIRSDVHYHPKKNTAIAFAIALELSIEETKELLMKAGFALSHSNKFDIIIEYCIHHQIYNIFDVNEILFAFNETLLGS